MSIAKLIISIANKVKSIKDNVLAAYNIIEEAGFDVKNKKTEELPSVVQGAINKAMWMNRGGELGDHTIFVDFDGTLLYAFTQDEIQALEELPKPYTKHENLTFQCWNYTLEELKDGDWHDVGAIYCPTDGFGQIEFDYSSNDTNVAHIRIALDTSSRLIMNWGDGTEEVLEESTDFDIYHTYQKGSYTLKYKAENELSFVNGLYVYEDTKYNVVGRLIFPTNTKGIIISGNNPVENASRDNYSGISKTNITELIVPNGAYFNTKNMPIKLELLFVKCFVFPKCDKYERLSSSKITSASFLSMNHSTYQNIGFESSSYLRSLGITSGFFSPETLCLERTKGGFGAVTSNGYITRRAGVMAPKLKTITFAGVQAGAAAFEGNINMEKVVLTEGKLFGRSAYCFANNIKIKDYGYPVGTTSYPIQQNHFYNNLSLETVTIGAGTKSIAR